MLPQSRTLEGRDHTGVKGKRRRFRSPPPGRSRLPTCPRGDTPLARVTRPVRAHLGEKAMAVFVLDKRKHPAADCAGAGTVPIYATERRACTIAGARPAGCLQACNTGLIPPPGSNVCAGWRQWPHSARNWHGSTHSEGQRQFQYPNRPGRRTRRSSPVLPAGSVQRRLWVFHPPR